MLQSILPLFVGECNMVFNSNFVVHWLSIFSHDILKMESYLDELDTVTGDGEHGSNMSSGMRSLQSLFKGDSTPDDLGDLFENVAMEIVNSVGGASGALYGTLFLRMSSICQGYSSADTALLASSFASATNGIMELGRVKPGDKTLLDSLHPASVSLSASAKAGYPLLLSLHQASLAAELGRANTAEMEARKGRASYQGSRSVGHIDPGATSMAELFTSLYTTAQIEKIE